MFNQVKQMDKDYILQSFSRVDVAIESGKGSRCTDVDGKNYIDFTSGIGVNSLGFCDEGWTANVTEQVAKLQHVSNYYYSPVASELAKVLIENTDMGACFFVNSGCEANECAIKVARKHGKAKNANKIITLYDSFHGRTLTTLAATGQDVFHVEFLPLTEGFIHCKANDIEALKAVYTDEVCGVMLECVQGEGGVNPLDETYLKEVRAFCDEKGILLIADEVQTGIGRTGSFFDSIGMGVKPDVITSAKGLGGGLPISTCIVSKELKDIFVPGDNGTTYGANPVACAGALYVVNTVAKQSFLDEVVKKGEYFFDKLNAMDEVELTRGKGLMIGIKLKTKTAKEVLLACAKAGLLVLTAKDMVRLLPPLNISYEEIDKGLEIFREIIKN